MSSDIDELNMILSKSISNMKSSSANPKSRRISQPSSVDEDDKEFTQKYVQWTSSDGKIFIPASTTKHHLVPGVYEIKSSPNIGTYFLQIPVRTEGLLKFHDTNSDIVINEIQKFWSKEVEDRFREYDLPYKRGILLWGPPGSGKSCTIQLIMRDVIERKGVVFKFDDPFTFIEGMRIFREIQPETPVVVTMEDMDSIIKIFSETEVLNILDGVNEVKKTIFLATTNYPGELGERIVNRPSRFDKRFKIGTPSAASRKLYFQYLIEKNIEIGKEINLDLWVKDTANLSIAHLKELFINVIILGNEYNEAIKTLQSMKEKIEENEFKMGLHTMFQKDSDSD